MDAVIDEVQRAVAQNGVGYAALLDDQVVLVASAPTARNRPRSRRGWWRWRRSTCATGWLDLTAAWGEGSEFRIAIDIGPVMASAFGDGTRPQLVGRRDRRRQGAGGDRRPAGDHRVGGSLHLLSARLPAASSAAATSCRRPARCAPSCWRARYDARSPPSARGSRFGRLLAATGANVVRRVEAVLVIHRVHCDGAGLGAAPRLVAAAGARGVPRTSLQPGRTVDSASTAVGTGVAARLRPGVPGRLLAPDGRAEPARRPHHRAAAGARDRAGRRRPDHLRPGRHAHHDRSGRGAAEGLAAPARAPGHRSGRAAGDAARDPRMRSAPSASAPSCWSRPWSRAT